jgi:adenylate cyclase
VRITAQLIEAETGSHLWADRFDGSMEDVFELQDQVATSVAGVIEPALQAAETRRTRARPTNDLTAYDLYLRSVELFQAWSKEPTLRALDLLARAIERDPRYGLALATAGFCHSLLFCSGWADDPEATRRMGIELAQRALQVAGDDPVALAVASMALVNFDQDVEPIIGLIDRSLALNPGSAKGWQISGWVRVAAGDSDRAIQDFATAERLDPRSPTRPFNLTGVGIAHFLAHRLDEAAFLRDEPLLSRFLLRAYGPSRRRERDVPAADGPDTARGGPAGHHVAKAGAARVFPRRLPAGDGRDNVTATAVSPRSSPPVSPLSESAA